MADALDLHDALWEKLQEATGVTAYDGEIVDVEGRPTNPPTDGLGRVEAHAILFVLGGRRYAGSLNGAQTSLDGGARVTCVGGDPTTAIWCHDQVRKALVGAVVTLDGVARTIRALEEDPGTVRRDDDKKPPRHWLPLELVLHAP